jgi:NAD-dependent dihydropyrimidine dehydrogenase PreA subunit
MKLEYLKNVTTIAIHNPAQCTGCGMCVNVCPHNVFVVENGKAAVVNKDACMECGACRKNCPAGIIEVSAGVGCAAALIYGMIHRTAPQCGCSGGEKGGCC